MLLFLIAVCFFFGKRMYISHIESEINKDSGLSIHIGALTLYKLCWGQVSVKNFSIKNPYEYKFRDAVTVNKIDVFLELSNLFSEQTVVDSIVLNGLNINYFVKENVNNISQILETASETSVSKLNEIIKKTKGKNGPGSLKINKVTVINSSLTLYIAGSRPVVVPLQNMTFDDISGNKGSMRLVIIKNFIEILQKIVNSGLNSKPLKVFNSLDSHRNDKPDESKDLISELISKLTN